MVILLLILQTTVSVQLLSIIEGSGVARICCEERQSWKLGHGALTADFRAGCNSGLMTHSFVTNAV